MPVRRTLLAWCLGLLALAPASARAETALAALDPQWPTAAPLQRELECLALNIYWEARSESLLGRIAVAAVTLNRVVSPIFPDTVCDVVFEGEDRGRHRCQFSWRCDGRTDRPANAVAWEDARRVARLALTRTVADPTGGALWYHADHVLPAWSREMTLRTRIGHHLFYVRDEAAPLLALEPCTAGGTACARLVPPSPEKPVTVAWPVSTSPAATALDAGLRIAPASPDGPVVCGLATSCSTPQEPLHLALGEASTALPFFDPKRLLGAPATAALDHDLLRLGRIERGARQRGTRPAQATPGGSMEALETSTSVVEANSVGHGTRSAGLATSALRARHDLRAAAAPGRSRAAVDTRNLPAESRDLSSLERRPAPAGTTGGSAALPG